MKHFLLTFFTLISVGYVNAQAPAIQWAKTFGGIGFEEAQSILQTTDGGYIVAGSTNYNNGDVTDNHANGSNDFWVVKLAATGAVQWKKCYGGSADERAYCIQQTSDGGYVVAGSSVSTDGDVTGLHIPNPNNPLWGDYWVIKIDGSGNLQWQKTIGGTSTDVAQSIIQTKDGGYVVVGEVYAQYQYDGDFANGATIVKLSSTGAIEWVAYGGNYNYSVKQALDGGYIVVGALAGKFNVVKLDSMGVYQWQKFYGGSSGNDIAKTVILTSDGGYMVAGYIASSDGDVTGYHGGVADAWLVKLDSSGDLQWQKTLGGSYDDEAYGIQQAADGGYIIAGLTNSNDGDVSGVLHGVAGDYGNSGPISDYWVVKTNSTGTIQWQKLMGGNYIDRATSIVQTTDGGYVVAGHTALKVVNSGDVTGFHLNTQVINASGYDYWIVKLAPDPIVTPIKLTGFSITSIACDAATLNWKTAQELNNRGFEIEQSTDGNSFYKIGFEAGKGNNNVNQAYNFTCRNLLNGQNYFRLAQIDFDGRIEYSKTVTVKNSCNNRSITLFPNPAGDYAIISFTQNLNNSTIAVYDITGKEVIKQLLTGNTNTYKLSTQTLINGLYVIKVNTVTGICNQKLIINK